MLILGASPFKVTALWFKVRILRFVTGPKEYTARVLTFVIKNSSKVGLLMFPVGIHGWSWNSEVQGQGTSVAFVIGILAGTFGTLVFRVGTLVSNSLFVGLTPCMYHYHSSFIFLAEFLKKCKPQKVPKP